MKDFILGMNKTKAIKKCQAIVANYGLNAVTNQEDINFLLLLFEKHSDWEQKKGEGVASISIIESERWKTKCFLITRVNGSTTDISWRDCINNTSQITSINKACRTAIIPEIFKYRDKNVEFGVTRCPISNEILTETNNHIDHYNSEFYYMFKEWLKGKDVTDLFSKVNKTTDNSTETFFTDKATIDEFVEFHNNNCKLRAVLNTVNLSRLKGN